MTTNPCVSPRHRREPLGRMLRAAALGVVPLAIGACGGGGGGSGANVSGDADLVSVTVGRLTDVYGLVNTPLGKVIELFEADVVVGPDIQDERDANSKKLDEEIVFDFIGVDPESLQSKLLITREIGSTEFAVAFASLAKNAMRLSAASFGQDTRSQPFSVSPRNAGFMLTFSTDLGLNEDFFVARDANGKVTGIKNPEAVQLLEILGDPRDNVHAGDFRLINARIAYKGNRIVLDPVILGNEGRTFNVPNTAQGLPESGNSTGANIRLALALEGPLRIRGLREQGAANGLISTNLAGRKSLIRDFRSGNKTDKSFWMTNGYVNDSTPPRLVGEMAMRLERVEIRSPTDQRVYLYKAGVKHEIDRGDVLKLYPVDSIGLTLDIQEVTVDPQDDLGRPEEPHVSVRVRNASEFLKVDPSRRPDYPTSIKDREVWLMTNGPTVVLATEFNGEKDDPLNFLTFSPKPMPNPDEDTVAQNRNVPPSASLIVRFTKPIDMATIGPLDSLILATLGDTEDLLKPKIGTPHLIWSQVFDEDGSQTALRVAPPLGFYIDEEMRKSTTPDRFAYYLHLVGGLKGIQDLAGTSLDFQFENKSIEFLSFPFYLDLNKDKNGTPRFPDNRIVTIARPFRDQDEDEDVKLPLKADAFGGNVYNDGRISGRPTSRVTSYVDDRNQLPSPPSPPLAYCRANETMGLTGATPFGSPIANPLNTLGCRLQTIWREIDVSMSRTNPNDFNLDVEQMWWAPFQASASAPRTSYDVFDRVSLTIGHSERRPSNCVDIPGSLPVYTQSGLVQQFYHNFLRSLKRSATSPIDDQAVDERPKPHVAYTDKQLVIRNEDSVFEPNRINRFLPLPKFQKDEGYLTWRDERVSLTGGGQGDPEILSPFRSGSWNNQVYSPVPVDGQVGSIALPLIADFWTYPDDPDLPKDDPFKATGLNGWQVSLTVTSSSLPNWRAYSGGGTVGNQPRTIDPSKQTLAEGGYIPSTGGRTPWGDSVCYWAAFDFLKRMSVMTYGFINLADPHQAVDNKLDDVRLGPYVFQTGDLPLFEAYFDPPLSTQPAGTRLIAEYRGADRFRDTNSTALDPLVAGEAHIRFFDSSTRDWVNHKHTVNLTGYVSDPNELMNQDYLRQFTIANQPLRPQDVKLLNWRFVFHNNIDVNPSTTPTLDSFALVYRIGKL